MPQGSAEDHIESKIDNMLAKKKVDVKKLKNNPPKRDH